MSLIINRNPMAAVAALITCCVAACATPRTDAERTADREMADRVQAEFAADRMLFARHITVRADGSVVTLGGYAWTPEEVIAAAQDAEQVSGVTRVVNRIEVDRGAIMDSGVTR